jgi:hypothetical protein
MDIFYPEDGDRRYLSTILHDVASQKIVTRKFIAMRTTDFTSVVEVCRRKIYTIKIRRFCSLYLVNFAF